MPGYAPRACERTRQLCAAPPTYCSHSEPTRSSFGGTGKTEGTKSLTHRLRSWFLRGVLEALERQYGTTALALLAEKVPRRLLPHASLDRLRASAALDTILLDDGEELLLFIDGLLGDSTGRVLEAIGQELASRALSQGGVAKYGDLHGTVARLQAFLDHPFVETPTVFELKRVDLGFNLTVGVIGRPRATRVLRHLAIGAVTAAERSAREGVGMKLTSDVVADRATLTVHYQRTESHRTDSEPPPTSARRPATHSFRPPSLSQEVERILASHKGPAAPYVPRITPVPGSYRSSQPSIERTSDRPPARTAERERTSDRPDHASERTSDVQPVAQRSAPPDSERATLAPSERKLSKG
jgi:hypothetical protein